MRRGSGLASKRDVGGQMSDKLRQPDSADACQLRPDQDRAVVRHPTSDLRHLFHLTTSTSRPALSLRTVNTRPPETTYSVRLEFLMSTSGFAVSSTRSAIFPVSMVPSESSMPRKRAGSSVAERRDSNGVSPAR